MTLLADYALTPHVFDETAYSSEEVCIARLERVKDVLLNQAIIRDLRNGDWLSLLSSDQPQWNKRGRELLKKLKQQNRFHKFASSPRPDPKNEEDWCAEALETDRPEHPLTGIIASGGIARDFASNPKIASIDRLGSAAWWAQCNESMRLNRTLQDYQEALRLVLLHSNSIMFIDPHLDPDKPGYKDFVTLLSGVGNRKPHPRIEIHRVCYEGSGRERLIRENDYFEEKFRREMSPLADRGLPVEIFIWDDFHDRYVISNLVGISVPYGFDTANGSKNRTTWTRLSRSDHDEVQKEFDPAGRDHKLHHQFKIG
jgi:hypothetical protein